MVQIPFSRSPRRALHALDQISLQAWIRGVDISEYLHKISAGNEAETWSRLDPNKLCELFWAFYAALAYCPLDAEDIEDLVLLANNISAKGLDVDEEVNSMFRQYGQQIAQLVEGLRTDLKIPKTYAVLVEFAKASIYYATSGSVPTNALPPSASDSIGRVLYRTFHYTTRDVFDLSALKESKTSLLCHVALPNMLSWNFDASTEFASLEQAKQYCRDFLQ